MNAAKSVVRFRTQSGEFAVPVEHVREVRTAAGMLTLPAPGVHVVGVLPDGNRSLTVVSALGVGRDQVLVLDPDGEPFGLLVEEVSGVISLDEARIGPPPVGQTDDIVSGVVHGGDELLLLVDARSLARTIGR